MMLRARSSSVPRNEALNPRTPVSAATPIATERITKKNFPRDDRISRAAIFAADRYDRLAIATAPPKPKQKQKQKQKQTPKPIPKSSQSAPHLHHPTPAPALFPRCGSAAAAAPAHALHWSYPDSPSAHPPARSAAAE